MHEELIEDTDSREDDSAAPEDALLADRYLIKQKLGAGGFAKVFRAHDQRIERDVAIKFLDLGSMGVQGKMMLSILERFKREATLAAKIQHVNVVNIYDIGAVDDDPKQPYIVMELLQGMDLDDYIKHKGPLAPKRLIPLFVAALDALGMAHEMGIVHKDLKPSNLFLSNPGTRSEAIRIVDFGIAHIKNPHGDPNNPEGQDRLTGTGQIFGTLQYLAPEYISHQIVGPMLDVYQMALILVELLCGVPVIRTSNPMDCLRIHTFGLLEIPDYIKASALAPVLYKALASDPDERFQNAREFADALSEIDAGGIPTFAEAGGKVSWVQMISGEPGEQGTAEHPRPTTEQLRMESQLEAGPQRTETNASNTRRISEPAATPLHPTYSPDTSLELSQELAASSGNEKRVLGLLVVAILVVVGVVIGLIASKSGKDADPTPAPEVAAKKPDPAPLVVPEVKPEVKPEVVPEVKPAPLPRIQLQTTPAGAIVWRGEYKLGVTPYEFIYTEEERNMVVQLRLELDGHKERNVEIRPDMTAPIALTLEPNAKPVEDKKPKGGKNPKKPKTPDDDDRSMMLPE